MSECAYCLCDNTNMKLHCGHVFHKDCVFTAVKMYHNDFCPLCRQNLNYYDYSKLCYIMNHYITNNLLYTGDFVNNKPHGYGLMRSLWYSYTGDWVKGMKHGKGVYNGFKRIYVGEWWYNLKHGLGTSYIKKCGKWEIEYDGVWKYNIKWKRVKRK